MNNTYLMMAFLVPLVIIQLGLQVYSIINLVKRRKVRYLAKPVWAIIILVSGIVGSCVYLMLRGEDE